MQAKLTIFSSNSDLQGFYGILIDDKFLYSSIFQVICNKKKCSNELSTKALLGRKCVLDDSTFRIQTVLEWVFRQVIFLSSCFNSVKKNKVELGSRGV